MANKYVNYEQILPTDVTVLSICRLSLFPDGVSHLQHLQSRDRPDDFLHTSKVFAVWPDVRMASNKRGK